MIRWPIVVHATFRAQPERGNYRDWKEYIANDCSSACVYCAMPEADFGGLRNFTVEHFRPKSIYRHLENRISNLYLACCICNSMKGDDWPGDCGPEFGREGYANPGENDFNAIFVIDERGFVDSQYVAGRYMVERLYLNRPQLLLWRQKRHITMWGDAALTRIAERLARGCDHDTGCELLVACSELINLLRELVSARPAVPDEYLRR